MTIQPVILQNEFWQVGIIPTTGASIAFGRVKTVNGWTDVMRPTPEGDYDNSSKMSSFIMMPWCNRIRDGMLQFDGKQYPLKTEKDDGTARHGDVRRRSWRVEEESETSVRMTLESREEQNINFPFAFSALAEYRLEGQDFVWSLQLKNEDMQPFPAGFGHHPYFVRPDGDNVPQVGIPCDQEFKLVNSLAVDRPIPVEPHLDFRQPRPLNEQPLDNLLTGRQNSLPAIIHYPAWNVTLLMHADPLFSHFLIFAPQSKPFFAVEPMTNANDGFNLYEQGITESGVFVLQPGERRSAEVRVRVETD
jgi:aldose 1-epimerase